MFAEQTDEEQHHGQCEEDRIGRCERSLSPQCLIRHRHERVDTPGGEVGGDQKRPNAEEQEDPRPAWKEADPDAVGGGRHSNPPPSETSLTQLRVRDRRETVRRRGLLWDEEYSARRRGPELAKLPLPVPGRSDRRYVARCYRCSRR